MNNSNELSVEEVQKLIGQRVSEAALDPVVFIDRFLYTFDPKRSPYNLPFVTFDFQKDLVYQIKEAIEQGNDLFIEKCREMGATYTVLAVFLWFWRYIPGSNFLLGSRKEDLVDNTKGDSGEVSNKEESLFGKLEYMINRLPPFMLPKNFIPSKHFNFMSLLNPELGNAISGESANANFSRGGRYKAVLLDEFSFWDNDSAAWGSTADTTNCRIVLTTPGIKPCKAKRLRFGKDGEEIKVVTLAYFLDPRKTPEWLEGQRKRRSKEDFAREIMINWEQSLSGILYPEISNAVVGKYPYNPAWPLYCSWDFGLDGTAIQWWQPNLLNGKKRLVDSYYNENKPIQFYFPLHGQPIDSLYDYTQEDLDAIKAMAPFKKAIHYGDPDVAKRSYSKKETTSTEDELMKIGIYVQTKPESNDNFTRQEKTKVMLQSGIEVNDTPRNDFWLEAIKGARLPKRSEDSQSTTANDKPIHDWTSHHRTSTEYFAVNYQSPEHATAKVIEELPKEELFREGGWY